MIEYCAISESNLSDVLAVSNRNLIYDQLPLDIFRYKTLEDPDFDPEMTAVAVAEGKPVGYIMAVCRKTDDGVSACVKSIAVDEPYRNQGIASEMLRRVEAVAIERGAVALSVGFSRPNYIFTGVDPRYTVGAAFLLRRGFNRTGEAYNMDVDLSASDWSTDKLDERLAKDNTTCRRLRSDEKQRLEDWMKTEFSAGWIYQVMRAADQDPVAVFIAEKAGQIIAFACYDGVRPGWFGPMGTSQTLRGGGVGSVTYLKCLQSMKAVGYKVCEINSVGPLYFYSKVSNAVVSRIFWGFSKKLTGE